MGDSQVTSNLLRINHMTLESKSIVFHRVLNIFVTDYQDDNNRSAFWRRFKAILRWTFILVCSSRITFSITYLLTDVPWPWDKIFLQNVQQDKHIHAIKEITACSGAVLVLLSYNTKTRRDAHDTFVEAYNYFQSLSKIRFENQIQRQLTCLKACIWSLYLLKTSVFVLESFKATYTQHKNIYLLMIDVMVRNGIGLTSIAIIFAEILEFDMICQRIHRCFEHIHDKVLHLEENLEVATESQLRSLRTLHFQATEMVHCGNGYWKYFLFRFCCTFVTIPIIHWYILLFADFTLEAKIMVAVADMFVLAISIRVSMSAGRVFILAQTIYDPLYRMTTKSIFMSLSAEVNLLLQRLLCHNIGFTCWDMFVITPNILLTVSTAILTYLLALKGFKSNNDPSTYIEKYT